MKQFAAFLLSLALLAAAVASVQADPAPGPVEAVKSFFGATDRDTALALSTGELREQIEAAGGAWQGADISDVAVLSQGSDQAVVCFRLGTTRQMTAYAYLESAQGRWQLSAYRNLALPGFVWQILGTWLRADEAQRRELADQEKERRPSANLALEMARIDLALQVDEEVIAHFTRNKAKFEAARDALRDGGLAGAFQAGAPDKPSAGKWLKPLAASAAAALHAQLDTLLISSVDANVTAEDYAARCGRRCAGFTIYGIIDNSVGFLWMAPGGEPPAMSPREFILIRPIGDGWYLYKTT